MSRSSRTAGARIVKGPVRVTNGCQFECPSCGRDCYAGTIHVEGEESLGGVIHDMPACEQFDNLDPMDFLVWSRKQMQKEALS